LFREDGQTYLDIAFDYASAGLTQEAYDLLRFFVSSTTANVPPMLFYTAAHLARQLGDIAAAEDFYQKGREASPDYCFPSRVEEMIVLESALQQHPDDPRAHYYLGNFLYDKHRREEAIHHWEAAAQGDPSFSIPLRNLGIAYYNVRGDIPRALASYEKAFAANAQDARLLYELDQLRKRTGADPQHRLPELQKHSSLVEQRDDLTAELITLYNQTGQHEKALTILHNRRFHPWEGGEGLVSGQYVAAHYFQGRNALQSGDAPKALSHFEAARHYPHNLGEGKHLLTQETHLDYFTGTALARLHRVEEARAYWQKAAATSDSAPNLLTYYAALALQSLNQPEAAQSLLHSLRTAAEHQANTQAKIDYFATSLPNFLIFEDDLQKRNTVESLFLSAMACLGLGETSAAIDDLQKVLALDKNHLNAHFELQHVQADIPTAQVPQS
jgi:tetratricopeptide (TPR) repeat protein